VKASELPGWRQSFSVVTNGASERERMSLREAVLDAIGSAVLSSKRIADVIHEEWGGCSDELLDSVLDELVEDCELLRLQGDRYTRGGDP
jgi:hypothetical protein